VVHPLRTHGTDGRSIMLFSSLFPVAGRVKPDSGGAEPVNPASSEDSLRVTVSALRAWGDEGDHGSGIAGRA